MNHPAQLDAGSVAGLQPLRDQILQQMSRAVAQGVVDMAIPD